MLRSISLILIACLFLASQLNSQNRLKSKGKIPEIFLSAEAQSAYQIKMKTEHSTSLTEDFYVEANFNLNQVLQDGSVLFNDDLSNYVNGLFDFILDECDLDSELFEVYLLNSPVVNAFATPQGIIFISTGLLARMENEAQLAFILSHELSHITENHSLETYVYEQENKKDKFRNNEWWEGGLSRYDKALYSRKTEMEADLEGLKYFLKTDFSLEALDGLFDILYYSFLPMFDQEIDKSLFESEVYQIPEEYWQVELDAIEGLDTTNQKLSTHPSSLEREEAISNYLIENNIDRLGKQFLFSEIRFNEIVRKARYEQAFLNYEYAAYNSCIYNSSILLNDYPEDSSLQKNIALSMRDLIIWKSEYEKWNDDDNDESDNDVELIEFERFSDDSLQFNQSDRIDYFLNKMNIKEALAWAMNYCIPLATLHSADEEFQLIKEDLFFLLVKDVGDVDSLVLSDSTNYCRGVLEQYGLEKQYEIDIEKAIKRLDSDHEFESWLESGDAEQFFQDKSEKGYKMGIDKIVHVDTKYIVLDRSTDESKVLVERNIRKEKIFLRNCEAIAEKSDLDVILLDMNGLTVDDIESFNDIVLLNKYFSTFINSDFGDYKQIYNYAEIQKLIDKYGTDQFLFTGVVSMKGITTQEFKTLVIGVILPVFFPLNLLEYFEPKAGTIFYATIFDVDRCAALNLESESFRYIDSDALMKSYLYDVYNQIYTKEK